MIKLSSEANSFAGKINLSGENLLRNTSKTLQINLGKLCNQACLHCHVEAGPKRTEIMDENTANRILDLLEKSSNIDTVDLTGGAPELNSNFKKIVLTARKLGKRVIDRCNLSVLFEKGQEDTARFLAENGVEVTASLPCYSKENVDKQRGNGVFDKSIQGLLLLNSLGYGKPNSGLILNLVYNPGGAFLPPSQEELERDYKEELKALFGIEFNNLFTITNMPIKRFLRDLERSGEYEEYMALLRTSYNRDAAKNIMCKSLVSIGWDGQIYDCDFNQMLEIPVAWSKKSIWDIQNIKDLEGAIIATKDHCFGCTAGAGSSCGGKLT